MATDFRKLKKSKPFSNGAWIGLSTPEIGSARIGPHDTMKGLDLYEKQMAKAGNIEGLKEPKK